MHWALLQELLSVCDKGRGGILYLPERSLLQQRLEHSEFAVAILDEVNSHPGGVEGFARSVGLIVGSSDHRAISSLKRPRPSSLAYSQVDSVLARSIAESQSSAVREFRRLADDKAVMEKMRQRGIHRAEPIEFRPSQHSDALRSIENLPASRAISAPALPFQNLAQCTHDGAPSSREPLRIALLLEEFAISRLAPYAAMQNEMVVSHLPNVDKYLREAPEAKGGVAKRPRSEMAKQAGARAGPPRERYWDDRVVAPLQSGVRKVV